MIATLLSTLLALAPVGSDCTARGKKLYGRVKVVTSFPDVRVQVVRGGADLRVRFVEAFGDVRVQMVDAFPGRQ